MKSSLAYGSKDIAWISMLGAGALALGVYLAMQSPYMIIIIPAGLILAVLILSNAWLSLAGAIILLPLFATGWLSAYLFPVPGLKFNNIIFMLLFIGFILNRVLYFRDIRPGLVFSLGSMLILIAAAARSGHVAPYTFQFWYEAYDPVKYFLSHGLVPMLAGIPVLMIIGGVRTRKEISSVVFYIALSLVIFSSIIIALYLFKVPRGSDFSTVREIIGLGYLGMHGNNLADFIIAGFPLLFALVLKPKQAGRGWLFMGAILVLLAAMVIYSRAAYLTLALAILGMIMITGKKRLLFPVLLIFALLIILIPGVGERALTGLEEEEHELITAGRTTAIWFPILNELAEELTLAPAKLIFGHGRFGITDLQVFRTGGVLVTTHPHNMYLDTLLDAGLIGLLFYMGFIGYVLIGLTRVFGQLRRQGDKEGVHIVAGLLVAVLSFMIRGMTDSYLLPSLTSSYFYLIMGLSFVVIARYTKKDESGGEIR